MIVSLEGPDKCGKSTLFRALQAVGLEVTYIKRNPYDPDLAPVMAKVERVQEYLFRQMYDPERLYLLDRSFTVSPQVYAKFTGRELLTDVEALRPREFIIYVDVPIDMLSKRAGGTEWFPEDRYWELVRIYREVLCTYKHVELDGTLPLGTQVAWVLSKLELLRAFHDLAL